MKHHHWTSWVVSSALTATTLGLWAGGGAIATLVLTIPSASAAVLSNWAFDAGNNQLSVTLPQGVTPRFLVFAEPARIVLEVPNIQVDALPAVQTYSGAVRRIEVLRVSADTLHIVLELAPGTVIDRRHAELVSTSAGSQTRWTLTPLIVESTAPIANRPATEVLSAPEPGPAVLQTPPVSVAEPTDLPPVSIPVEPAPETLPEVASEATPVASEASVSSIDASEVDASGSVDTSEAADAPESVPELLPEVTAALPPVTEPLPSGSAAPPSPALASPAPVPQAQTPTIPATSPPSGPRFIQTPEGQLSIRATNLMLPPSDSLATLPNTLPLDPFEPSFAPATQVSVPPLDSAVAVTPNAPLVSVPSQEGPPAGTSPASTQAPGAAPAAPTAAGPVAVEPPSVALAERAPAPAPAPAPAVEPPASPPDSSAVPEPPIGAIASNPPTLPLTTSRSSSTAGSAVSPIEAEPVAAAPIAVVEPSAISAPPPSSTAAAPTATPALPAPAATSPAGPATVPAPPFLAQEPPFLTAPAAPASAPAIVSLPPAAPAQTQPGALPAEPVPFIATAPPRAASEAPSETTIAFGEPLPAAAVKEDVPSFPYLAPPAGAQPHNPEELIPQGTLLQLQYPGAQPLQLDQHSAADTALILAADLHDAKTGALIAPAGSQVVGQFAPDELGLRWVSQALVLPGRNVSLTSASAYLAGPPQVGGQSLALNSGIGALALTVLTGFSGVGLIGGALMGATATMGTAPQTIVVEPNQIIEVQVLEAVPRAIFHVGG